MNKIGRFRCVWRTVVFLLSLCVFQKGGAELLLHYTFDDGYTSVSNHALSEVSGGVYVGGASCWGITGLITPGNFAARMGTNNASSYVESIADSDELDELDAVTITAWINLQSLPENNDRIASKLSYSGGYYEGFDWRFFRDGDDLQLSFSLCSGVTAGLPTHNSEVISRDLLGTGVWRFLAVTYSGDAVASFFVGKTTDNSLVQLSSSGTSFDECGAADTACKFRVGSTQASSADRTPDMFIDDVRIYNTVLSSNELDVVRLSNLRNLDANEQDVLDQITIVKSDSEIRGDIAAASLNGGGLIEVDPGVYRVSRSLKLPSNIVVMGSDASDVPVLKTAPDHYIPLITNDDWVNGNENISLLNMTLDGCAAVQRSNKTCITRYASGSLADIDGVGVYFRNVSDFRIEDLKFQNLPNEAIYLLNCNNGTPDAPCNLSAVAPTQSVAGVAGEVALSWREHSSAELYRLRRGSVPGVWTDHIDTATAEVVDPDAPSDMTSYYIISCVTSTVPFLEGKTSCVFATRPGLILDNSDTANVTLEGTWFPSTSVSGYVDNNYLHDGNATTPKSVTFSPDLSAEGNYRIYLRWTSDLVYRSDRVPVTVSCAGESYTYYVNQKINGGSWMYLGDFDVIDTNDVSVCVANYYADGSTVSGYVVADSACFVLSDVAGSVRNCEFTNCSQLVYNNDNAQGVVYMRGSDRIAVRGNTIEDCDEGCVVCGSDADNNLIEYNYVTNCVSGEGVYLGCASDNTVRYNSIFNVSKASQLTPWVPGAGAGIAVFSTGDAYESRNNLIACNTISDIGGSGISVFCQTNAVLSGLVVDRNLVDTFNVNDIAGKAGISLWRASDVSVVENTCAGGNSGTYPAPGIKACWSDAVVIDGNTFVDNPGGSVVVQSSTNVTGSDVP